MPNNKYLYLSSINASNAADFQVNLPENLIIQPYSEVRAVSVRVNPNDNAVDITKDENDTFYIGIDNWNKFNQAVPPVMVIIQQGIYGINEFAEQIEKAINEDTQPFCYVRDCATVSVNNNKLTFKMSQNQMNGIPSAELTDDYLEYYSKKNNTSYEFENLVIFNTFVYKERMNLTNSIYGVEIVANPLVPRSTFKSPEIVQGLVNYNIEDTGNSKEDAPVTAHLEIDTQNMDDDDEIFISMGFFGINDVYNEFESARPYRAGQLMYTNESNDERLNIGDLGNGQTGSNNMLFIIEVKNDSVTVIRPRLDRSTGQYDVDESTIPVTENAKLKIDVTEYEQVENTSKSASFFNLNIDETTDNGANYTNLFSEENYKALEYAKNHYQNQKFDRTKKCIIDFNVENEIEVLASFAVDPEADEIGFNRHTGTYAKLQPLNTNLTRVLSILGNQDYEDEDSLSSEAISEMTSQTGSETGEKLIDDSVFLWNEKIPNVGRTLGIEVDSGLKTNENSYSTGIVADEKVDFNEQQFPQFYLDIPTLPLGNLSANYLQGRKNTFVCPIDLQASENNINLYTSQLYTMNYNQLTNSYPLNINTMKIRICNIDGSVAQGIEKETIVCLEIRDNPDIKNDQMIVALRNIEQNYSPGSQTGDFRKDQ